jgi:uncharacterized membrane protein
MIHLAVAWAGSLVAFLILDIAWLGLVARDFYHVRLAGVIDMQVNWPFAGLFYMLHVIGVMVFVTVPAVQGGTGVGGVLLRGALYGFFTYATYDLTNLATVRGWPVGLAFVDIAWGMLLNAAVALAGFWILRRLG